MSTKVGSLFGQGSTITGAGLGKGKPEHRRQASYVIRDPKDELVKKVDLLEADEMHSDEDDQAFMVENPIRKSLKVQTQRGTLGPIRQARQSFSEWNERRKSKDVVPKVKAGTLGPGASQREKAKVAAVGARGTVGPSGARGGNRHPAAGYVPPPVIAETTNDSSSSSGQSSTSAGGRSGGGGTMGPRGPTSRKDADKL